MADRKDIDERIQRIAEKIRKEGYKDGMDFIRKFFEEQERSDPELVEELSDYHAFLCELQQG